MANPSQKVAVSLAISIVAVMADQSEYAFFATNQGINNLNVLKRRMGIWPMLGQQEEDLWQWQPKKFIMQAWHNL
jgi:hypothetical protein